MSIIQVSLLPMLLHGTADPKQLLKFYGLYILDSSNISVRVDSIKKSRKFVTSDRLPNDCY